MFFFGENIFGPSWVPVFNPSEGFVNQNGQNINNRATITPARPRIEPENIDF